MTLRPTDANLLVTSRCNLHCRHCTVTSQGPLNRDISVEQWAEVLDRLAEAKILRLTVTGGEPFARRDFPQLLREMLSRPFRLDMNTNGTLLTAANIDLLEGAGSRIGDVMIGLDGASAETVNSLRGEGTFEMQMQGLSRLAARGLRPGFYCTVTTINVDSLPEIARLAAEFGDWIKFNPIVLSGPVLERPLAPSPAQLLQAARRLRSQRGEFDIEISGVLLDMLQVLESGEPGRWPAFGCGALRTKISVMPNGDVTPCDHLPALRVGSLLEACLEDVLKGSQAKDVLEVIDGGLKSEPACMECPWRDRCIGGCPVGALSGRGDIRDPLCCLAILREES